MARKTRLGAVVVSCAACWLTGWGARAGAQPAPDGELTVRLAGAVDAHFWGAVLVARGGEPLLAAGWGPANAAGAPITPGTLFDIGSCSKQFTAAAVLRLAMAGTLSLDDEAERFFPALAGTGRGITLRHLLGHTSGMTDETALQPLGFADRDRAVRLAFEGAPRASPGERFEYCNAGYVVLAAVVEVAGGRGFEAFVREEVFAPAGMTASGFLDGAGLDRARQADRVTSAYGPTRRAPLLDKSLEPWGWGLRGAGGVVTTLTDLLAWDRALRGGAVLDERAAEEFFRPGEGGYALGWFVEKTAWGTRKAHHSGRTRGFTAQIALYPDDALFVVVLSGEDADPTGVEQRLAGVLVPVGEEGVECEIRTAGIGLGKFGAATVEGGLGWAVERAGDGSVELALRREGEPFARVVLRPGSARTLLADLTNVSARVDGGEGGMVAMVGTRPYAMEGGVVRPGPGLAVWVMPAYHGVGEEGEILDEGPTLVVCDEARSFWPLIVRMDAGSARALVGELGDAVR